MKNYKYIVSLIGYAFLFTFECTKDSLKNISHFSVLWIIVISISSLEGYIWINIIWVNLIHKHSVAICIKADKMIKNRDD